LTAGAKLVPRHMQCKKTSFTRAQPPFLSGDMDKGHLPPPAGGWSASENLRRCCPPGSANRVSVPAFLLRKGSSATYNWKYIFNYYWKKGKEKHPVNYF
jgi:hypothetical protein